MHEQNLPRQSRGRRHRLQEVEQLALLDLLRRLAQAAVVEVVLVLEAHRRVGALARHRGLAPVHRVRFTPVAREMVPDRLGPVLRDRERDAARGALDRAPAVDELGTAGVGDGLVVVPLREGRAAPRGIDIHLPRGVGLEHLGLARRELVRMLGEIGCIDGEQGFVRGEGVGVVAARLMPGRRRLETAIPSGNRARRIAGALRAHRRQLLAQPRRVGHDRRGKRHRERRAENRECLAHNVCLQNPGAQNE